MSGPVPKRSDQRRRRNKASDSAISKAPGGQPVVAPEPNESWHPMAVDWYNSLVTSGQSQFYEASDWQTARIWGEILSRQLNGRISAQMIAEWGSAATNLLTTEGARRKARVELQRGVEIDADEDHAVAMLAEYQSRRASG